MSSKDTFVAEVPKEIIEEDDFIDWQESIDGSVEIKIAAAIEMIEGSGIVTNVKALGDGLYEKKWNSGLRLYFAIVIYDGMKTLLILGSKKGREQSKAINKSKNKLKNYDVFKQSIKINNGD